MSQAGQLSPQQLQELYKWIDKVPLSRPKRNIARDFSDGVLMSEVIHHFFPNLVDLHNYVKASNHDTKTANWITLNAKVTKKMGFQINRSDIESVCKSEKGAIERVLYYVQLELASYQARCMNKEQQMLKKKAPAEIDLDHSAYDAKLRSKADGHKVAAAGYSSIKEKEEVIKDLRETISLLQVKAQKLEKLVALKDEKVRKLESTYKRLI